MYDELTTDLRSAANTWLAEEYKVCAEAVRYLLKESADAIEELSKPKWIPVTEQLPKYGERVLVFEGFTMYVAYYDKNRYGGESWHKLNSKNHYCNPTHWMQLPEPPKERK